MLAEWITAVVAITGLILAFIWRRYDRDCGRRATLVEFMHTEYDINSSELDQMLNKIESLWGHKEAGRVHALRDVVGIVRKSHTSPRPAPVSRMINYGKLNKLRWQLCEQMRDSLLLPSRQLRLQVTEFKIDQSTFRKSKL